MKEYIMKTDHIGFGVWNEYEIEDAEKVWGEPEVTKYICASGRFSEKEIKDRLQLECQNYKTYGVQYFPIFELVSGEIIGCCGLRPSSEEGAYEIGFHLRSKFWRKGLAAEAANAVIQYAWEKIGAEKIYAGHHPKNEGSKRLLAKLGFHFIGNHYYEPTGLYHPSYEMKKY